MLVIIYAHFEFVNSFFQKSKNFFTRSARGTFKSARLEAVRVFAKSREARVKRRGFASRSVLSYVRRPAGRVSIEGLRPYAESLRSIRYPENPVGLSATVKSARLETERFRRAFGTRVQNLRGVSLGRRL